MLFKRFLISVAAAATGWLCGPSHAVLTPFTTQASFAAAVVAPSTDTFAFLPLDFVASPSARTTGPYGYVAARRAVFSAAAPPRTRGCRPIFPARR